MTEGQLVASSTRGRYAIGSEDGPDLTSGMPCEIEIGGQWVKGSVEHATNIYVHALRGYYFVSSNGDICGLCVGMIVRVRW